MKRIFMFVGVAFVAISVKAEYLWWTVDSSQNDSLGAVASWIEKGNDWTTANLYYYKSIKEGKMEGQTFLDSTTKMSSTDPVAAYDSQVDISALVGENYSYYIELVNSSGTVVGYTSTSEPITYTSFAGSITTTLEDIPSVIAWHGGSYRAAPEPTSAMLMLLGIAGLALKRKKRKQNEV